MNWRVPLADLDFGAEESAAVQAVLQSRWLTMGSVTQAFEEEFAAFSGVKYAFAVSNATVALHMAYLALGVGEGDEVIAPSLTFVATTNAALYTGARVRFAEILGEQDLNICPESIEASITPKTKVITVVHYGGFPCRMEEITQIARKYNLAIIEDAAHAPGAALGGRSLGTWGDIGCFSFFSNKNLSTGEGGMLVTNRADIAEKIRLLRSHGMTSLTWDRHRGHAHSYDVVELGYNYRIDEIRSALGREQLKKLTTNNWARKTFTEQYWQALRDTDLGLPFQQHEGVSSHHLLPILLPPGCNRIAFMEGLREAGIQTSIHYPPIHTFTYYRQRFGEVHLPITEGIAARQVTLPLYPTMGEENVRWVTENVIKLLENNSCMA